MNNPLFIKRLRESMEQERDLGYSAANWQAIEERLGTHRFSATPFAWWWLALPLLLLLIGVWQWTILKNTQAIVTQLEQKVRQLEEYKVAKTHIQDTVVHKVIVYDTIFRTIIIENLSKEAPSLKNDVPKSQNQKEQKEDLSFLESLPINNELAIDTVLVFTKRKNKETEKEWKDAMDKGDKGIDTNKEIKLLTFNWAKASSSNAFQSPFYPHLKKQMPSQPLSEATIFPLFIELAIFYEKDQKLAPNPFFQKDFNIDAIKRFCEVSGQQIALNFAHLRASDWANNMNQYKDLSPPKTLFHSNLRPIEGVSSKSTSFSSIERIPNGAFGKNISQQNISANFNILYYFPTKRWQAYIGFSGFGNWQRYSARNAYYQDGQSVLGLSDMELTSNSLVVNFREEAARSNLPELPVLPKLPATTHTIQSLSLISHQQDFFDLLYELNLGIHFNF